MRFSGGMNVLSVLRTSILGTWSNLTSLQNASILSLVENSINTLHLARSAMLHHAAVFAEHKLALSGANISCQLGRCALADGRGERGGASVGK